MSTKSEDRKRLRSILLMNNNSSNASAQIASFTAIDPTITTIPHTYWVAPTHHTYC